jgi:hypothetical protein
MRAINGSLRKAKQFRTGRDRYVIIPFTEDVVAPIPSVGVTDDLDAMIDITDGRRLGEVSSAFPGVVSGEVHPNYLERGWFPRSDSLGTNILKAMSQALDRLSDPAVCSKESIKHIFLFTDGVATHSVGNWWTNNGPLKYEPVYVNKNSSQYNFFRYENCLAGEKSGKLPGNELCTVNRALKSKVSISTMHVGEFVMPNFRNVPDPLRPGYFMSMEELFGRGYFGCNYFYNGSDCMTRGGTTILTGAIIPPVMQNHPWCTQQWSGLSSSECGYLFAGTVDKVIFDGAAGALARLSYHTGGTYCPLTEPYRTQSGEIDQSCYDEERNWKPGSSNCKRSTSYSWSSSSYQRKSVYGAEKTGQAMKCMEAFISRPPVALLPEYD